MQTLSAENLLIFVVTIIVMGVLGVGWKSSKGFFRVEGGGEEQFDRLFFWAAATVVVTLYLKLNVSDVEYWLWRVEKMWRF